MWLLTLFMINLGDLIKMNKSFHFHFSFPSCKMNTGNDQKNWTSVKYDYKYILHLVIKLKHNISRFQILFKWCQSPGTIKSIPFWSAILWSQYNLVQWYLRVYFLKWRGEETNPDEGEPWQGYRVSSLSCILSKLLV